VASDPADQYDIAARAFIERVCEINRSTGMGVVEEAVEPAIKAAARWARAMTHEHSWRAVTVGRRCRTCGRIEESHRGK
jgi:hypothetical protein